MGATTYIRAQQVVKAMMPGVEIDIRGLSSKLKKEDLHDIICESVRRTQQPIIVCDLPNWLTMSHKQFVKLLPYTAEMYQTEDRMYQTPMNIMEVEVDEDLETVRPEDIVIVEDPTLKDFESELDSAGESEVYTKEQLRSSIKTDGIDEGEINV